MRTRIENVRLFDGRAYEPAGFVEIDGNRIARCGAEMPGVGAYDEVIDGGGGLLLPGLINAHTHAAMTLVRGVGADLPLREWLHAIWPLEERLDEEAVYWASLLAAMEMARRGITAYADMYCFADGMARAVADSGIRANLSTAVIADDGRRLRESVESFRRWDGACGGRIRYSLAVHAEYTSDPEHVTPVIEAAERLGAGLHLHLSETDREVGECFGRRGVSPVRYFDGLGAFRVPTLAAHAVAVDAEDIRVLAERGVYVAHNPISNMKLASGIAPVPEMLAAGVPVALGTDGVASNNQYDLFAEMRMAAILQKGARKDPTLMPAAAVFGMATEIGARAIGFPEAGAIRPGALADLAILDPLAENLSSRIDPASDLVYAAQGLNVVLTMVDGRVVYRNGEFPLFDAERARARFRETQDRLYSA